MRATAEGDTPLPPPAGASPSSPSPSPNPKPAPCPRRLVDSALYGPVWLPSRGAWLSVGTFTVWEQPVAERLNWAILRHKRHCASDPCAYVACSCAVGLHAILARTLHPDVLVHHCAHRLCQPPPPSAPTPSPTPSLDALLRCPSGPLAGRRVVVLDASGCPPSHLKALLAGAHHTIRHHRPAVLLPSPSLSAPLLRAHPAFRGDFCVTAATPLTACVEPCD
ncbi:hypothetical protein HXX76_014029 [Chlamydomonas incerta]|uniref:Uncharacterized protein n=1 Tax=Chlamydomonas incerta TaxID=51695 RepID=A0A835SDB8_CHLIN|nr:hypothetical protein HXX76_014029 [Chlamydomonas incerta]|eukprot:KAG2424869.1 hypothetical protein HXX76_014029 [Chlamydomonas incerta]